MLTALLTSLMLRAARRQRHLAAYYAAHPDRCYMDDLWRPGLSRRDKLKGSLQARLDGHARGEALVDAWMQLL